VRTVNHDGPSADGLFSFSASIYVPIGASDRKDLCGRHRSIAMHIDPDDGIVRVHTYVDVSRDDADAIWRPAC